MLQAEDILQNRYQLKHKLGDNAARQTWLANDLAAPTSDSQVVVKLLAFGGQVQWENLKLFEREAQILKQLNHSQIPKYQDYFCIDDRLLWFGLVENYIPRDSFKDLLNQGKRFTEKQVRQIAVDVLKILIYLHELNPPVLHRDIKPSNLILGEDEKIYLVDFGAVQDKAATEGATFTVVGTYGYTPMEQFGGRAVPASDLYALGATLIHLLTGTTPADLPQRDLRIQFSDRVTLSPSFINWLEKLTEPAPERRFNTAQEAFEALNSKTHGQSSSLSTNHSYNEKIYRPLNTRVQLNKSPLELEIKIRGTGILKALCFAASVYIFIFCLTASFPVIWLFGIFLIFRNLEYCFGTTQVKFDRNSFEIKRQLFKLTYFQHKVATSHIQDVSLDFNVGLFSKPVGVTITSGSHLNGFIRRSFGRGLNEAELIWLVQEIREWLQAQK